MIRYDLYSFLYNCWSVGNIDRFDFFYYLSTVSFYSTNGPICGLDSQDKSYWHEDDLRVSYCCKGEIDYRVIGIGTWCGIPKSQQRATLYEPVSWCLINNISNLQVLILHASWIYLSDLYLWIIFLNICGCPSSSCYIIITLNNSSSDVQIWYYFIPFLGGGDSHKRNLYRVFFLYLHILLYQFLLHIP